MKTKKIAKFSSLSDAYSRAMSGEEDAQKCIIGCLNNLGCDHLASSGYPGEKSEKWQRYYRGLQEYISALVGEYGVHEDKAEKEILAELNAARSYSDDVLLV